MAEYIPCTKADPTARAAIGSTDKGFRTVQIMNSKAVLKHRERTWVWQNCLSVKSHGASSTLNIGECPNVAIESFLSQILQPMEDVPEKYYLSARACLGILRRAKERGKELPEELKAALER